jgi:membrane-associated phospholipid phosphatase
MIDWKAGLFGIALVIFGSAYQLESIHTLDVHLFATLYGRFNRLPWIGIFRVLWLLGTSPAALVILATMTIIDWRTGVCAAIALGVATLVEAAIKMNLRRARPFTSISGANMLQPVPPKDASFPSGDAMRVWFFVAVLAVAFHLTLPMTLTLVLLALMTSLGRVAMGVHYPLDVLAGAGLGLAAWGLWMVLVELAVTL